ncbi:MAG TPA: glycosyltransferase [Gammaproteobacteria bacterium]|nr:glycosyltransferase [Gammaproteobacteria bacterium]
MKKRMILVTNIDGESGTNNPIFTELKKHWDNVERIDPYQHSYARELFLIVKSFKFNREKWRLNYHDMSGAYRRSPLAFKRRTKVCETKLGKITGKYNVIFQTSSLLVPPESKPKIPFAIYLDRTLKMNERYSPEVLKTYNSDESKSLHNLHKKTFDMADRIFTFNDATNHSLINDYHVNNSKIINVGSGVNLKSLPDFDKNDSNLILTVCSNFERQKGQLSLDAFMLVKDKLPHAKFMLVGKKLEKDDDDQINSVSSLPYERLLELYLKATIVIQPGPLGGLQTITEAMANKCICIAHADNPYIPGLIHDNENGFLVHTNNAQEIAGLISTILNNDELKKSVGQKAYQHIVDNYTWESVVTKISNNLKKIV